MFQKQEKKREEKFLKKINILKKSYNHPNTSKEDKLYCENKLLSYGILDTHFNSRTAPRMTRREAFGHITCQPMFE